MASNSHPLNSEIVFYAHACKLVTTKEGIYTLTCIYAMSCYEFIRCNFILLLKNKKKYKLMKKNYMIEIKWKNKFVDVN